MSKDRIKTLLTAMGAITGLLERETAGDAYFAAVVDRFATDLTMAGVGLESLYRAEMDTQEFAPVVIENGTDTQEVDAVVLYDAQGRMVG